MLTEQSQKDKNMSHKNTLKKNTWKENMSRNTHNEEQQTLLRSSSFVIMTIVWQRCSQIIRQKSPNVSGSGPW